MSFVQKQCGSEVLHVAVPADFSSAKGTRTTTKQKRCQANELMVGDCWIAIIQAKGNGLILATRVEKHTDELILLLMNKGGKTDGQ